MFDIPQGVATANVQFCSAKGQVDLHCELARAFAALLESPVCHDEHVQVQIDFAKQVSFQDAIVGVRGTAHVSAEAQPLQTSDTLSYSAFSLCALQHVGGLDIGRDNSGTG